MIPVNKMCIRDSVKGDRSVESYTLLSLESLDEPCGAGGEELFQMLEMCIRDRSRDGVCTTSWRMSAVTWPRTLMVYDRGTCLLVEGLSLEIVDDSAWKKPEEISQTDAIQPTMIK